MVIHPRGGRYERTLEVVRSVPRLGARELAHQGLKTCLDQTLTLLANSPQRPMGAILGHNRVHWV
jgi:hypothetical protein